MVDDHIFGSAHIFGESKDGEPFRWKTEFRSPPPEPPRVAEKPPWNLPVTLVVASLVLMVLVLLLKIGLSNTQVASTEMVEVPKATPVVEVPTAAPVVEVPAVAAAPCCCMKCNFEFVEEQEIPMLAITGQDQGSCQLCMEKGKVFDSRFKDGLKGQFCAKCMLGLLDRRFHGKEVKSAPSEAGSTTPANKP